MQVRSFVLTALFLLGCHSNDDHPAPASAPSGAPPAPAADPCRFVTNDEVASAIGAQIVTTQRPSPVQCAYYPTPPPGNALYVTVGSSAPYASMKQMMRNAPPVAEIGDDAIWAAPQLIVKAGAEMITIGVMDTRWHQGDSKAAAVAVARAALPRITQ